MTPQLRYCCQYHTCHTPTSCGSHLAGARSQQEHREPEVRDLRTPWREHNRVGRQEVVRCTFHNSQPRLGTEQRQETRQVSRCTREAGSGWTQHNVSASPGWKLPRALYHQIMSSKRVLRLCVRRSCSRFVLKSPVHFSIKEHAAASASQETGLEIVSAIQDRQLGRRRHNHTKSNPSPLLQNANSIMRQTRTCFSSSNARKLKGRLGNLLFTSLYRYLEHKRAHNTHGRE